MFSNGGPDECKTVPVRDEIRRRGSLRRMLPHHDVRSRFPGDRRRRVAGLAEKGGRARRRSDAGPASSASSTGRRQRGVRSGAGGQEGHLHGNDRVDRLRNRRSHRDRSRREWWRRRDHFGSLRAGRDPFPPLDLPFRIQRTLRTVSVRLAAAVALPPSFFPPARAPSPSDHPPAVPETLSRAESLFQVMKSRDYPAIFAVLSAKSRETIVAQTSASLAAAKMAVPGREAVRNDFVEGGPIARGDWDAFLRNFDPDSVLEHSRWEIGSVGKDRAEIHITHHGADRPAALKMFLEEDGWNVGLVETFWAR